MRSELITFRANKKDKEELCELIDKLGLEGIYGAIPQVLKFSISYTLSAITQLEKVIPDLDESKLSILLDTIKRSKILAQEAKKKAET